MGEGDPISFQCMSQKKQVKAVPSSYVVMPNGAVAARGTCPECGSKLYMILKKTMWRPDKITTKIASKGGRKSKSKSGKRKGGSSSKRRRVKKRTSTRSSSRSASGSRRRRR